MDKNKHLESVIKTHQITKEEQLLNKHRDKSKDVKESLEKDMEAIFILLLILVPMLKTQPLIQSLTLI